MGNIQDKRHNFNFKSVHFPHLSKPTYGVYISQLVRIGRICSDFDQFNERHYRLTQRLIQQRFRYSGLCLIFKKFARAHAEVLLKYKCSICKHIEEGVCLPVVLRSPNNHLQKTLALCLCGLWFVGLCLLCT